MNDKERALTGIVDAALENLEEATQIKGIWKRIASKRIDGEVELQMNDQAIHLYVAIKKELRNHQLTQLLADAQEYQPLMVIAENIFPQLKAVLRENDIAYLERNGNIWLKKEEVLVWIDTKKLGDVSRDKINRAFTKTGLKVVFQFLLNEALLRLSYREIARQAGVALGQVNYVFNGLKEMGFLVKLNKDHYQLTNKKGLLDKWLENYEERLKPALFMGRFRFLKREDFDNWKKIPLKTSKSWWGGEAAGDLYTHYLKPEQLTIYTLETKNELIRDYRMIPDPKGNIHVYAMFWNEEEVNAPLVPPLLAYTDLINTADQRCIDTANRIYHEFLEDRFK